MYAILGILSSCSLACVLLVHLFSEQNALASSDHCLKFEPVVCRGTSI
jgi:hypothetical protein